MTRRIQSASPAEPPRDALVAMYEHEALRLMLRCLYRQFLNEENAAAVRTAATLLKSLPPARRGCDWIEALEAVDLDFPDLDPEFCQEIQQEFARLEPEEMDAEILAGIGVEAEAGAGETGETGGAEGEVGAGAVVGESRTQRESHRHPSAGWDPDSRASADKSGA
ncbi:hypothetical protein [Maricaulis sp.]|uniref:hypothetical protein n=1 Tax=Maricaulis sp. TaxID=1486257 RepID=UPI003A93F489